jgi:hypothetical protein
VSQTPGRARVLQDAVGEAAVGLVQ